jgi:hypothetical protein
VPPQDVQRAFLNPLGIYVTAISWTQVTRSMAEEPGGRVSSGAGVRGNQERAVVSPVGNGQ